MAMTINCVIHVHRIRDNEFISQDFCIGEISQIRNHLNKDNSSINFKKHGWDSFE